MTTIVLVACVAKKLDHPAPMEGLAIGQQLAWLDRNSGRSV